MEHVYLEEAAETYICGGHVVDVSYEPVRQLEEVVRCGECAVAEEACGSLWCAAPMGSFGYVEVAPDDFCSCGLRRCDDGPGEA